jgi:sulfate adenylyltransferase large subunit
MQAVNEPSAAPEKTLLRFITCGSVDDGKSTLIGRMLYEAKMVPDDILSGLTNDSKKHGTQGANLDFALLVDGLEAEREQGITIDVAYRYFATPRRKFIVADTPGHEQYTRNMATGASTADLAILLVDARKGILPQTRRHSHIVSMLGVKNIIVAINKMDLMDYAADVYARIEADYREFAANFGFDAIVCIPVTAKDGDNILEPSAHMGWYQGPSLLTYLETVEIEDRLRDAAFRLPVQWVNRPSADFRGFSGLIAGGRVFPGDRIRVLPSGRDTKVARVIVGDKDAAVGVAGQSVTLTLADEVDASRGDVITLTGQPAMVADRLTAKLLWVSPTAMVAEKSYLIKLGTRTSIATPGTTIAKINIGTGLVEDTSSVLELNEIGTLELALDRAIVCDTYAANRELGGFILIDRLTNDTIAMGLIEKAHNSAAQTIRADISYESMDGTVAPAEITHPPAPAAKPYTDVIKPRLTGSLITLAAAFIITNRLDVALSIAAVECVAKLGLALSKR